MITIAKITPVEINVVHVRSIMWKKWFSLFHFLIWWKRVNNLITDNARITTQLFAHVPDLGDYNQIYAHGCNLWVRFCRLVCQIKSILMQSSAALVTLFCMFYFQRNHIVTLFIHITIVTDFCAALYRHWFVQWKLVCDQSWNTT